MNGGDPRTSYRVDGRRTPVYRACRRIFETIMGAWFRPEVSGQEHVPATGAVILAPVHRSFADFGFTAFLTRRKLFFMAKAELWENRLLGRLLDALGAFPVRRTGADREALRRAEAVLAAGEALVLFPEGTRQTGPAVGQLLEGAAFLAARTQAPIVPVGIGGSGEAMPKGTRIPKRLPIRVVVGEPVTPPAGAGTSRLPRSAVHATSEALRRAVQKVYDEAESSRKQG